MGIRALRGGILLFYSRSTRHAFIAFINVTRKITGIGLLLLMVFVIFYFFIRALFSWYDDEYSRKETEEYFIDNSDGIFNLFVAMTTANHPDILMSMYDGHWYLMAVLVLFMICTNLVLVNVLLAVICSAYSEMIRDHIVNPPVSIVD